LPICLITKRVRCRPDGVDVIQFDEPAFNVYTDDVVEWAGRLIPRDAGSVTTAVQICYGYGIKANVDWKASLGSEGASTKRSFPRSQEPHPASLAECTHRLRAARPDGAARG